MIPPGFQSVVDEFEKYVSILGATAVVNTVAQHDGSAHIELINGKYHFITTERGREFEHRVTASKDEILYWLLSDVVFWLACDYELYRREAKRDPRRLIFVREVELLGKLNPDWAARKQEEQREVLLNHPFDDASF